MSRKRNDPQPQERTPLLERNPESNVLNTGIVFRLIDLLRHTFSLSKEVAIKKYENNEDYKSLLQLISSGNKQGLIEFFRRNPEILNNRVLLGAAISSAAIEVLYNESQDRKYEGLEYVIKNIVNPQVALLTKLLVLSAVFDDHILVSNILGVNGLVLNKEIELPVELDLLGFLVLLNSSEENLRLIVDKYNFAELFRADIIYFASLDRHKLRVLREAIVSKDDQERFRLRNPLDICDEFQRTPLILAAYGNSDEAVRNLLSQGANPLLPDHLGNNCMAIAAYSGSIDVLSRLCSCSYSPDLISAKNLCGSTPLSSAIYSISGNDKTVSLTDDKKANLVGVIYKLLKAGADNNCEVEMRDFFGRDVVYSAREVLNITPFSSFYLKIAKEMLDDKQGVIDGKFDRRIAHICPKALIEPELDSPAPQRQAQAAQAVETVGVKQKKLPQNKTEEREQEFLPNPFPESSTTSSLQEPSVQDLKGSK